MAQAARVRGINARRRRPQARALLTRSRVLRAAERLYAGRGYEATSMAQVAQEAEVGVGSLYHHFSDKRALLLALIDDWGDRELERARTRRNWDRYLGSDPKRAIYDDLRQRYLELRNSGGFYLVLLELADRDYDIRQRLRRIQQVSDGRLAELIRLGQAAGTMRKSVNPAAGAFLIRHSIDMAATEVLVQHDPNPSPEGILEELASMISRYILEDHLT